MTELKRAVNELIRIFLRGTTTQGTTTITTANITDINLANDMTVTAGGNVILATATGSQIGTAAAQLLGFHGAMPVDQAAAIADASGGATIDAEARTAINALLASMREKGLIAT